MRKHRLFGVVTAVLLGTSLLHPRPSSPQDEHHLAVGNHVSRAGIQLTSATLSVDPPHVSLGVGTGADTPIGLLRPAGTKYLEAALAWSAYVEAHPPPPPPARPTPVVPATYHVATPVVPPLVHVATPVGPATLSATGDAWAGLRRCESGGNYAENTGNGYYGAYQFSASTWHGLGFPGLPSDASPAVQDRAAQQLQARSGWGQWPSCSRRLRLT